MNFVFRDKNGLLADFHSKTTGQMLFLKKMESNILKRRLILAAHIVLVTLFIFLPWLTFHGQGTSMNDVVRTLGPETNRNSVFIQHSWLRFSIQNTFLSGLFYLNYLFLAPYFISRKKNYLQFAIAALASMFLFMLLISYAHNLIDGMIGQRPKPFHLRMIDAFLYLIVVVVAGTLLHLALAYNQLEQKQKEAELHFLRSQINPHFLFNSLNNIYSLAILRSENTAGAILKLSGLLRFVLYESGSSEISLDSELKYIDDYIALQQLRLNENVRIDYRKKTDFAGKIHPMLLVPFIENAFKHGISYSEPCTILIGIESDKKAIRLKVVNTVYKKEKEIADDHGIGLKNTLRRLELVYPGKHSLEIRNAGGIHTIELMIERNED